MYCSQGPRVSRDQPRKLEFEERNETQICLSVRRLHCVFGLRTLDSGGRTLSPPLRLLERGRTNGTAEQPARHTQTLNRKRLENFPKGAQLQLAMGQQFGNSESGRLPRGSINFESLIFHPSVPRDGVR